MVPQQKKSRIIILIAVTARAAGTSMVHSKVGDQAERRLASCAVRLTLALKAHHPFHYAVSR